MACEQVGGILLLEGKLVRDDVAVFVEDTIEKLIRTRTVTDGT